MALHGEGEPAPTLLQTAEQAVKIELFTQWQTYRNGVHMDRDTFDSIDFRALAVAAITGAGFTVKTLDAAIQLQKRDAEDVGEVRYSTHAAAQPRVTDHYPPPGSPAWEEMHDQVQAR